MGDMFLGTGPSERLLRASEEIRKREIAAMALLGLDFGMAEGNSVELPARTRFIDDQMQVYAMSRKHSVPISTRKPGRGVMSVVERVLALMDDYYLEHKEYPRRITVSDEVARELDAELASRSESINGKLELGRPRKLRLGSGLCVREVLVVADMDPKYIVDVR